MPHHILTTQTEPWGFIMSLAQNQSVHMEHSLHLSFYHRHSLGGYKVGTTVGFLVLIVEALVSYPIPRKRERSLHTCAQDVQITRMATI
jgi:hypothetical protein